MDWYLELDPARRRTLCDAAGERLGLHAPSIEKDLWICWTVRELFALERIGRHLTFKGGTSLSKGWGLIQRFSEDVDVVIDRGHLGFGGARAPDAPGLGTKERDRRLEELRAATRAWVRDELGPALERHCARSLRHESGWGVAADPADPDGQTILLHYRSVFGPGSYLRPVVRIELGARSDTEPVREPRIRSFLEEVRPDGRAPTSFAVRTVAPERTFWEKAMLLHEEAFRSGSSGPKDRLARHYYDLWCLIRAGVGASAAADDALFERIAAHRAVFFRKKHEAQATLARGTLRLHPAPELIAAWERDYEAMRESMLFGQAPGFAELLAVIEEFEVGFNTVR